MIIKNSSEKKTILLVDDEIIFANALSKKMQSMGYDIIIAQSGGEVGRTHLNSYDFTAVIIVPTSGMSFGFNTEFNRFIIFQKIQSNLSHD